MSLSSKETQNIAFTKPEEVNNQSPKDFLSVLRDRGSLFRTAILAMAFATPALAHATGGADGIEKNDIKITGTQESFLDSQKLIQEHPYLLNLETNIQSELMEAFLSDNPPTITVVPVISDGDGDTESFSITKGENWETVNTVTGDFINFEDGQEKKDIWGETIVTFDNFDMDKHGYNNLGPVLWIAKDNTGKIIEVLEIIRIPLGNFNPTLKDELEAQNFDSKIKPLYSWGGSLLELNLDKDSNTWEGILNNNLDEDEIDILNDENGNPYNNFDYPYQFSYNGEQIVYNLNLPKLTQTLRLNSTEPENPDNPFLGYFFEKDSSLQQFRPIYSIPNLSGLSNMSTEMQTQLAQVPTIEIIIPTNGNPELAETFSVNFPKNCDRIEQYIDGELSANPDGSVYNPLIDYPFENQTTINPEGDITMTFGGLELDTWDLNQINAWWIAYDQDNNIIQKYQLSELNKTLTPNPYIDDINRELQAKLKNIPSQAKVIITDGIENKIDSALKIFLPHNYATVSVLYNGDLIEKDGLPIDLYEAGVMVKGENVAYLTPQNFDDNREWLNSLTDQNVEEDLKNFHLVFGDQMGNYFYHTPVEIVANNEIQQSQFTKEVFSLTNLVHEPKIIDADGTLLPISESSLGEWIFDTDTGIGTLNLKLSEAQKYINQRGQGSSLLLQTKNESGAKTIHQIDVPQEPLFLNDSIETIYVTHDSARFNFPLAIDNVNSAEDLVYNISYQKEGSDKIQQVFLTDRHLEGEKGYYAQTTFGLAPDSVYEFSFIATDLDGNESEITTSIKTDDVLPPPPPPSPTPSC